MNMNLTLDADDLALDSISALALAVQLQSAASILFVRTFDATPATTEASPSLTPESDRLISIRDGALRLNKHRSWMNRHGRTLGILICDSRTGRVLGCSEHAISRFLGVDPSVARAGRKA